MKRFLLCMLFMSWSVQTLAAASGVLIWEVDKDLETSYKTIYKTLEDNKFFVVFEPNIQKNLARFADRWGENYNRNKLEGIRAMVFCNAWYANQVSNADPNLMALCPLHITLIQQSGRTRILFAPPTLLARGSKAEAVARELEQEVSRALDEAVAALR